ncbi:hypothetical protein CH333_08520 [candidate division WOR-3 bacterium JGI_Cruoil_03_44_89]|uniref:Steroid 5-alpha reductase C-terminal domain-containing protein n=1 Tax=candidate division WOR-3 bacterium JGI_Cruoil_03_44_89 TaxID=1973748 RepID=A0A235BPX0_UNCW3|nr:MAG: hypothetical protein CH333_08520 [candidate division WOR-3 bacterium JGI_Cruoil_03_44_89]
MMWKKWIFRYRGCIPVLPCLVLILLSNPCRKPVVVSLLLVVFGELIRILSTAYIGGRSRSSEIKAKRLISDGPYSRVRNPIYIGNFFIGLGFVFLFNVWVSYILPIYISLFLVEYAIIINTEENFLLTKFEEEYKRYKQSVPSIIPLLRRYNGERITPNFIRALKSERDTLVTIILVYLLAYLAWSIKV